MNKLLIIMIVLAVLITPSIANAQEYPTATLSGTEFETGDTMFINVTGAVNSTVKVELLGWMEGYPALSHYGFIGSNGTKTIEIYLGGNLTGQFPLMITFNEFQQLFFMDGIIITFNKTRLLENENAELREDLDNAYEYMDWSGHYIYDLDNERDKAVFGLCVFGIVALLLSFEMFYGFKKASNKYKALMALSDERKAISKHMESKLSHKIFVVVFFILVFGWLYYSVTMELPDLHMVGVFLLIIFSSIPLEHYYYRKSKRELKL